MEYTLAIEGREKELNFKLEVKPGENAGKAFSAEAEYSLRWLRIDENRLLLEVNGRLQPVYLVKRDDLAEIWLNGERYLVKEAGVSTRGSRGRPEAKEGLITPPMPAQVIRVLVREGDRVRRGQGLLVLSAMKMETGLSAPYAGTVKRINAAVGVQVAPGDILAEIEPCKEDR